MVCLIKMSEFPDKSKNQLEQWWYNNQPNYGYNEILFKNFDTQQPIVDKYGEQSDISTDTEI